VDFLQFPEAGFHSRVCRHSSLGLSFDLDLFASSQEPASPQASSDDLGIRKQSLVLAGLGLGRFHLAADFTGSRTSPFGVDGELGDDEWILGVESMVPSVAMGGHGFRLGNSLGVACPKASIQTTFGVQFWRGSAPEL
jgi:hypothetical protein